jgi:hypothetical protein
LTEYGQERSFEAMRRAFEGREAAPEPGIEDVGRFEAVAPGIPQDTYAGRKADTDADLRDRERARQTAIQTLDLERQRAALVGQLTPELEAQLALRERDLALQQDSLTEDEKRLVNAKAELAVFEQMVRLDPMAGLAAGFAEAANRSRELGTELRDFARETSADMGRFFSDNFFNLFTGRKGEDAGKRFAEGLLRSVTDLAGRQLAGVFAGFLGGGGVRGAIPLAGGGGGLDLTALTGGGGGGAVLSTTGLPAGQLVMTADGISQVMPSGAVQPVQGGGFNLGGDTAVSGLRSLYGAYGGLSSLGANYAVGGLSGAFLGVPTVVAGGTTIAVPVGTEGYALAELGQIGVDASLGSGTSGLVGSGGSLGGATAAGGVSLAGAASGVLAAVALGFTIYGALKQEPTVQNIAVNAISGAVSGAVVGAVIGSFFGPGYGTLIGGVIGAIVGGAAAGGATGIKAPRPPSVGERSEEIGRQGADAMSGAVRQSTSIEDLVTIFNTRWAPHGEVQILTTFDGVRYGAGDYDDPAGAPATPALMVIPEFLDALDIRVGQTGATVSRGDLISQFRTKRDELLTTLAGVPFGMVESDAAAGITRRTYLPFQKIYGLDPQKSALFASSDFYRQQLGADDNTVQFLFDRLREVSQARALVDMTRQDFLAT